MMMMMTIVLKMKWFFLTFHTEEHTISILWHNNAKVQKYN